MDAPPSTDTTGSNRADETVRQRMEAARHDPTQPLALGTTPETDEPVTLSRTEQFSPILITSRIGTGKTTLCHHLATQQLTPDSGLCYVSGVGHAFAPPHPNGRVTTSIDTGPYSDVDQAINAVPDDIGTTPAIHNVALDCRTKTAATTGLLSALVETILRNRYRQIGPDTSPYTLVFDGLTSLVEMDSLYLRRLLAEARKLRLHIIIATQTLTTLPLGVQRRLDTYVQTYLTGHVARTDATHLARSYPTLIPDDLETLPHYHWWLVSKRTRDPKKHSSRARHPSNARRQTKKHRGETIDYHSHF